MRARGLALLAAFGCSPVADPPPDAASLDADVADRAIPDAGLDAHLQRDMAGDATPPPRDAVVADATPADGGPDAQPRDATADASALDARVTGLDGALVDGALLDGALPDSVLPDGALPDGALPDGAPLDAMPDQAPPPARPAAPGDLVITELMVHPHAAADGLGEWIEVVNLSADWLDLDGIVVHDGADDVARVEGRRPVGPGRYAVLARSADPAENGGLDPHGVYPAVVLRNPGDTVSLTTAADAEIDRIDYDDARFPVIEGASMQFDADFPLDAENNDGTRWCASRDVFGAGDRGTPGAPNPACAAAFTAEEFQALLVTECPGCHTANGRLGGLNLDVHTRSIGRPSIDLPAMALIEPGDRARSYLFLKLTGAHLEAGGLGEIMPPKGALEPVILERIGRYIDSLPR